MPQQNIPSLRENNREEEQNRRRLWPFLLLLFFVLLLTSCIVGFILGRKAAPAPMGQIIDTVLLTPNGTAEEVPAVFHLTGHVFYTDGTPAAGRTLELHSDPKTTLSDSKGGFLFDNVPEGNHRISVLAEDGTPAAERNINVVRDSRSSEVAVDLSAEGAYVIKLAIDVRILEIEIALDSGELYINPDRITYATQDGLVVTPAGSASVNDGAVVSPGGNVYLPDGTVVLPGGQAADPTYIITRENQVLMNQPMAENGIVVSPNGTVTLPDGTSIVPGGKIETPSGTVYDPGYTGVVVSPDAVIPIGGTNVPAESDSAGRMPENGSEPGRNETGPEFSESSEAGNPISPEMSTEDIEAEIPGESSGPGETTASTDPVNPSSSESPVRPTHGNGSGGGSGGGGGGGGGSSKPTESTNPGELEAFGQKADGTYVKWTQGSTIDLFYNRTGGMKEKIAPGSSGFYLFRLKNSRTEDLKITVNITEKAGGPYIPLQFTLRPQGQKTGGVSGSLIKGDTLSLDAVIPGSGDQVYRLDWVWPFDGGRDDVDTAAGRQGGVYALKMTIHAEGGTK